MKWILAIAALLSFIFACGLWVLSFGTFGTTFTSVNIGGTPTALMSITQPASLIALVLAAVFGVASVVSFIAGAAKKK
jgi:hypothetical protein